MKVYRIRIDTPDCGTLVGWAPNQAAARAVARKMLDDAADGRRFDKTIDDIAPVDIPTDKLGLIAWLSQQFGTDNG